MKKIIFLTFFLILSVFKAFAGEYRITYLKGDINLFFSGAKDQKAVIAGERLRAGDSLETKDGARFVLAYSGGAEIRADGACGITIAESEGTVKLKLRPGRYFINAPYAAGKKHEIDYEGGKIVFNRGIIEIRGKNAFFYSGRPVGGFTKNVSAAAFPEKPDEWQTFNSFRDKRTICLEVDAPEEFRQFYFDEIKKGALVLYPVLSVNKSADPQGCGTSCYVRVTMTPDELMTTVSFNRFYGNKAKLSEITSPIQKAIGPNARLIAANTSIIGVLRAIEIELDAAAVESFIEGNDVTVEAEVKDANSAGILFETIKSIRGVEKAEINMYYGQKAVIRVKIMGTALEIVEALNSKKSEFPSINVWNFERDIVKLKFM